MKLRCLLTVAFIVSSSVVNSAEKLSTELPAGSDSGAGSSKTAVNAVEKKPGFNIYDFQIDGNTILDDETLERAVYPYLGPDKTVDDVEKARAALEEAYRNKGFPTVVVSIPEQDVNAEQVRLAVLEGAIETVRVTGYKFHKLDTIRESVPALAEGKVPDMPKVQEQINTLSMQSADRNVTPIFRAGSTPGKMEVELRVKDELPLHGSVEMNSRNSESTTYSRVLGSLRYDNLWQKFHSASLQFQTSPENADQVQVWSGTYVLPTGWLDTKLALYGIGISSNTQLGVNIGGMSVVGAGNIYGARLVQPLPSTDSFTQSFSGGLDYKEFGQGVNLLNASSTTTTSINYLSFMTGYDGTWRGDSKLATLGVAAHYSFQGLANDQAEFTSKRAGATPDFVYLTSNLKYQQSLPKDIRVHLRADGQVSSGKLVSNEQFSAGGPLSVRGYHQTQLLGDNGVALSMELHSPKLVNKEVESVQNLRVFSFVDWANIWTYQPIAPTPSSSQLASTGVGLRMLLLKHFTGEFDWSYPMNKQSTIDVGQQRVDFRVAYEF